MLARKIFQRRSTRRKLELSKALKGQTAVYRLQSTQWPFGTGTHCCTSLNLRRRSCIQTPVSSENKQPSVKPSCEEHVNDSHLGPDGLNEPQHSSLAGSSGFANFCWASPDETGWNMRTGSRSHQSWWTRAPKPSDDEDDDRSHRRLVARRTAFLSRMQRSFMPKSALRSLGRGPLRLRRLAVCR